MYQAAAAPKETPHPGDVTDVSDPVASAEAAGCHYVVDGSPGIRRVRCGTGFRFIDSSGHTIKDRATLSRIRGLVLPPAWTAVWICPDPDGHLQATGRDARGRKQYRYHPRFREIRDENKYERMLAFAGLLPEIRKSVDRDLGNAKLTREKVLATIVRLLEITLIRVGNEEYARENGSFGLTTLRGRHVDVDGSTLRFQFRGKSGKDHTVDVKDLRLARIVQRCHDLPGEELFQYFDEDGALRAIESADVNEYLKGIAGDAFTAKDFRTWAGTVLTASSLVAPFDSMTEAKRNVVAAIRGVSARLGNTLAVCRKCYVHPDVVESYLAGELSEALRVQDRKVSEPGGLSSVEAAVLSHLRDYAARKATKRIEPKRPKKVARKLAKIATAA